MSSKTMITRAILPKKTDILKVKNQLFFEKISLISGKFRNPESPPPHRTHEIIAPAMMEGDKFDKYGFPIEPTGSSDYR